VPRRALPDSDRPDRLDLDNEREDEANAGLLALEITGELWHWRGPSPYHFVSVPDEGSAAIRALATVVTYGWGMIPVEARIGQTAWETSLFPKDGRYLLPVKDAIRKAEGLELGDAVSVELVIRH
jgi:Domain of unknown function (DUF1905)